MAKVEDNLEICRFIGTLSVRKEKSRGKSPRIAFKFLEEVVQLGFKQLELSDNCKEIRIIIANGITYEALQFVKKVWESIIAVEAFVIDTDLTCTWLNEAVIYKIEPVRVEWNPESIYFDGKIISEEHSFPENESISTRVAQMFIDNWNKLGGIEDGGKDK